MIVILFRSKLTAAAGQDYADTNADLVAIPASAIARAITYAIEQPVEVEVDEMVIRPTVQDF